MMTTTKTTFRARLTDYRRTIIREAIVCARDDWAAMHTIDLCDDDRVMDFAVLRESLVRHETMHEDKSLFATAYRRTFERETIQRRQQRIAI